MKGCDEGAGRQAVKVLDRHYGFNRQNLMADSADSYDDLSRTGMAGPGDYLKNFKLY